MKRRRREDKGGAKSSRLPSIGTYAEYGEELNFILRPVILFLVF